MTRSLRVAPSTSRPIICDKLDLRRAPRAPNWRACGAGTVLRFIDRQASLPDCGAVDVGPDGLQGPDRLEAELGGWACTSICEAVFSRSSGSSPASCCLPLQPPTSSITRLD